MSRDQDDALDNAGTPEARRIAGHTPLLDEGSPSTSVDLERPPARRRRINLTSYLLKQAEKTPPIVKEHLTSAIEGTARICRSWQCWLIIAVLAFVCLQSLVVQYTAEVDDIRLRPQTRRSAAQLEIEDDMDSAYRQWKVLQEANPKKFGNFSKFLMDSKHRESKLRKRLSALNEESLNLIRNIVVPPAGKRPLYTPEEEYEMLWSYLMPEKSWPYVGSERYLEQYQNTSRYYYNSLAVFPHNNRTRQHGLVGIWPNGTRAWVPGPMPPPIKESPLGAEAELKNGGFYLKLSNALPLDRDVPDQRASYCAAQKYKIDEYEDASVVIVFYNEHLSTLLRSVHSVLNNTPPPLLREIILVDDHSNSTDVRAGGILDEYIKLLPKTKILRLPERRGIVQARTAGAKIARAPIFVMLDSHIEVGPQWLEPQAKRLRESPKSVVFPQILAIDPETFQLRNDSGIGCFLSFKWMMQERPYFNSSKTADPVASPSLAGGLFAVRREWFFDIGGYDDEFKMWGAENVEMGFRYWMCGGRVECMPCSLTYHIYRHGGSGYKSPGEYISKNRRRTAILWTDKYYQVAREFIDEERTADGSLKPVDIGSFEKMKALKKRFHCKSFDWFLKNIDPGRASGSSHKDYGLMGEIRNLGHRNGQHCIDSLQNKEEGKPFGIYPCHHSKGSQGWFEVRSKHQLRNMGSENICLSEELKLTHCEKSGRDDRWVVVADKKWIAFAKNHSDLTALENHAAQGSLKNSLTGDLLTPEEWREKFRCLAIDSTKDSIALSDCVENDKLIQWDFHIFTWDPDYTGPPEMQMDDYNPADYDDDEESAVDATWQAITGDSFDPDRVSKP